jgi:membrane protein
MHFLTNCWLLFRDSAINWSDHKDARQGAAIAYYSIFSLGPVLIIAIAIAGFVFGEDAARGNVEAQLHDLLGDATAKAVDAMLVGASKPAQGFVATAFGLLFLFFAAIGVVVQLKDAFNIVWDVDSKKISGVWQFIRAYLVSLAAVIAFGFLLLVSLLFTTGLAAAGKFFGGSGLPVSAIQLAGSLVSFAAICLLFAMIFKWLPDTDIDWHDVWLGAAITSALFEIGKVLIGVYIGQQAFDSTYGAAASLVVLLIWVYYSSQIVLFGAEFTHVYALRRRSALGGTPLGALAASNPITAP